MTTPPPHLDPAASGRLHEVQIRRAPRVRPFALIGVLCGLVAGLGVGLAFPSSDGLSRAQGTGMLLLFSIPLGLALGLACFAWAVWRSRRASVTAQARVDVLQPELGEVQPGPDDEPAP